MSLECNKTWRFWDKNCPYLDFSWWCRGCGGTPRCPASTTAVVWAPKLLPEGGRPEGSIAQLRGRIFHCYITVWNTRSWLLTCWPVNITRRTSRRAFAAHFWSERYIRQIKYILVAVISCDVINCCFSVISQNKYWLLIDQHWKILPLSCATLPSGLRPSGNIAQLRGRIFQGWPWHQSIFCSVDRD